MEEIREKLVKELERTTAGTEEYDRIFENLIKLERLELEQERNEADAQMKEHQKKRDILDLVLRHGLTVLGIGMTTYTTIFLFGQGMQFEKEDSFRSTTMRNFMSKNFFKLKNW